MNYSTTLDLRDIAGDWQDTIDDAEGTAVEIDDGKYIALCEELGIDASHPSDLESWANDNESVMILQSDFVAYAEQLAEDIGAIDPNYSASNWPLNCIDWEKAARELAYDYTSITYDGQEYYIRST